MAVPDSTTNTGLATLTNPGSTTGQTIAPWAQGYVGDYLGRGQALSQLDYQPYQGDLTAGPGKIQQNLFTGIGNLGLPANYGQSWTSMGAPTMPNLQTPDQTSLVSQAASGQPFTQTTGAAAAPIDYSNQSVAAQYMNPYLQQSLQPQLNALQYQAQQDQQSLLGNLTKQGAFGGSRQAVAQGIGEGNLLNQQANLIGQGYNTAYTNALNQFNQGQQNANQQVAQMAGLGATQQGLSQADTAAKLAQYQTEQAFPYQQLQFEQSLLNGLPVTQTTSTPNALSGIGSILAGAGAISNPDVKSLLKNLGINV
jgi:hypothetical protein